LPKGHIYKLGYPGEILRAVGMPDLLIELKAETLTEKADINYKNYHPFDLSEIKDLPRHINDPVAVLAYGNKTKAVNIITEIKQSEKNFLVGIALNPEINGNKLNVNSVRTVFPKDILERLLANPRCPEDVTTAFVSNI
jgi:hypothetical protein